MTRLGKRPNRRRRSQGCTAAAAAATTLFLSSTCSSSSALLAAPSCFVHPRAARHRSDVGGGRTSHPYDGLSLSKPQHAFATPRQSRLLAMKRNDDEHNSSNNNNNNKNNNKDNNSNNNNNNDNNNDNNHDNDQEEDEEEEYNEIKSSLNKISWLPSVKLGKQPYRPSTFGRQSRKENAHGEGYESLPGGPNTPPGCENIEILPVLPMTMVHGLEGMFAAGFADGGATPAAGPGDGDPRDGSEDRYAAGVWEEDPPSSSLVGVSSSLGPIFSGTSSYLPHTKGHVFTVAEPRYKRLYDDLVRLGDYYGRKRDSALRRRRAAGGGARDGSDGEAGGPAPAPLLPDPDEKRRFIVAAVNPAEDGVFAQYGMLFQLKDLDEVAAVASYETEDGEEDGTLTLDELKDIVESVDRSQQPDQSSGEDIMDILLRTHYEATHDVVGRVKIHRFVNPECYDEGGPEGEDYLMAEATVLDVVENDRARMLSERKQRRATAAAATAATASAQAGEGEQQPTAPTSLTATARAMEEQGAKEQQQQQAPAMTGDNIAKAVARIKEELRSTVGQGQQMDPERIKDKLRAALDDAPATGSGPAPDDAATGAQPGGGGAPRGKKGSGPIPLVPGGVLVERRATDSLAPPERALRESFAGLVALQHELGEECRFTRVSVRTFGIGPVGVWLSAAAWSQFVEKRLEASHGDMQSELQERLVEYLGLDGPDDKEGGENYLSKYGVEEAEDDGEGGAETIDFEDLSPELQNEFQLVQARATVELGPLALERAIQMQRIVQAGSYVERLELLRECVENERKRLEAKKMLKSLGLGRQPGDDGDNDDGRGGGGAASSVSREEARSIFERLIVSTAENDVDKKYDSSEDDDEGAFQ